MGAFFGLVSDRDAVEDVFYGTDYLSHLGTHLAGMACYDKEIGLQREIHNIENSPFRTKFEHVFSDMKGTSSIACISDKDPQPLLIRSKFGAFALCFTGVIKNKDELLEQYLNLPGAHFDAMTGGRINSCELIAALINLKGSLTEGITFVQNSIKGTMSLLIILNDGKIIACRDKIGRIPLVIGKNDYGMCASFESFAFRKLGYKIVKELGPGEIVELDRDGYKQLKEAGKEERICSFLWTYYGYPTSTYSGIGVESARNLNGRLMAKFDVENKTLPDIDYVGGVPDSGVGHALGYAFESGIPYARAIIKYTPTWSRSFTPPVQSQRDRVAKMKQIPVIDLIKDKKLLFVDDSIVRGTQLKGTVSFLFRAGAKEVHMRTACPPIMYGCKFLDFSRQVSQMELLSRHVIEELEGPDGENHIDEYGDSCTARNKAMREAIAKKFGFSSLGFQSLDYLIKAIGLSPCKLCTYCWNGKE